MRPRKLWLTDPNPSSEPAHSRKNGLAPGYWSVSGRQDRLRHVLRPRRQRRAAPFNQCHDDNACPHIYDRIKPEVDDFAVFAREAAQPD